MQPCPIQDNFRPCLGQSHIKLHTLFRTERPKTIPSPAAHPHIGHIRDSPCWELTLTLERKEKPKRFLDVKNLR